MVWQRMIRRLRQGARPARRTKQRRRLLVEQLDRRELLASDLGAIAGVAFIDEAGDGSPTGDPPVLVDAGGDLVAPGTPGAQGIQVQLFEDTNGDTVFDGGDLLVGTDTTDLSGNYRFDSLTAGRYFLVQQAVPQLDTPTSVTVDVSSVGGIQTALIDDYSLTRQQVIADPGTPTSSDSMLAPEVIGGARDIQTANTNGIGQLSIFVDEINDRLSIGSLGDAEGTALLQYDGNDGSIALDATGLGGESLAGGTPGSTLDPNAGLLVLSRAGDPGDTLFITIHTDAGNSSTAAIPLQDDPSIVFETFVPFSSFTTSSGAGADFNDVGAIEASVGLTANNDIFVSIVEARRPDLTVANVANIQPLVLAGVVFNDNDPNGGQNNGLREGTEAGITGIDIELYELAGPDDVVDPATSLPIATTTTGPGGVYSFSGLNPGHYATVIPNSQFAALAPLFGFASSTGNDPANDPDDNVRNDDNGTTLPSDDVASGTITLISNAEPIDDGDTDANTNVTVDFGVIPQIDLFVTMTLNDAASNIIAGGNAVFDVVIQNRGPLDATDVRFDDLIPSGFTFAGIDNETGPFTTSVNGSTATVFLGTVDSGTTESFQLLADIGDNQTTDVTNSGTATANEVETDIPSSSAAVNLDLVESDLRLVKTDVTDPTSAGAELVYTITVTNDGPDQATNVTVLDELPAGVSFVSGDVDGATNQVAFDAIENEATAFIGTLANGASAVVTLTVLLDQDAGSPLSNTATVSADPNTDPDLGNNSDTEETVVERVADVAVAKTVSGSQVAGRDVTYTIEVTNTGPGQARGISVSDVLDGDLSLIVGSFDPGTSGTTIDVSGQTLTFDVGTLDQGAVATFTFDVSIAASATGTIPNTAVVSTTDIDNNAANDSASTNITVQREIDMTIDKAVSPTTAVPGQTQLVYTYTVEHGAGSVSDAENVVVTDTLPAGVIGAVISAPTADSTDFSNGTVTVVFDSLAIGETATFTVTVDTDESATGVITNTASVTSVGTELNSADNTDSASTTLTPQFDVTLNKSVDDSTPAPASQVTYTIDVTNSGPSTATGVALTDDVPAGLTFVSGSIDGQAASLVGGVVTFPTITLDSGASETATVTFLVGADADGLITNTASVPDLSAAGETVTDNNSATADITVTPEADLAISQSVDLDDALVGSQLTYSFTVDNNGPSTATNVVIADTLPAGVTFVSGTGPGGEALTESGGIVNVAAGDLSAGGSIGFTVVVMVDAGATGTLTNSGTVSSDTLDLVNANNTANATTTIDPSTSSIAGLVFLDINNNGVLDGVETGIADVTITLTGEDFLGNAVSIVVTTDAGGNYRFETLAAGTYIVTQTQPDGLLDGSAILGTGATAIASDNVFSQLGLGSATSATEFNFSELNEPLSKRRFLASSE